MDVDKNNKLSKKEIIEALANILKYICKKQIEEGCDDDA